MKFSFPVKDVTLKEVGTVPDVKNPLSSGEQWQANGAEFSLQAPGVGAFYVRDGREVIYSVAAGADSDWVRLYLNGQVLVALLHQRQIINFHASSFLHKGQGVMILGDSGAGKTSLMVAFSMNGAGFMTDDITPVVFREEVPHIWSLNRKIKLRSDSIEQLDIRDERLTDAEAGTGKKYFHLVTGAEEFSQLGIILKIERGEVSNPVFKKLSTSETFSILRSEICSWEYLAGMPETEVTYLQQLVKVTEKVNLVKVVRPEGIRITEMYESLKEYLG